MGNPFPRPGKGRLNTSRPEFVSPSPLAFATRDTLYLIDADANPRNIKGTPGVLFEVNKHSGKATVDSFTATFTSSEGDKGVFELKRPVLDKK